VVDVFSGEIGSGNIGNDQIGLDINRRLFEGITFSADRHR
jgi:hypothetical protein